MAQYTVKAPDGKTITLNGPEGASESDVIAIAQQLYKPEAPSGFAKGLKDLVAGGGQAVARGLETAAEYVGYQPAIDFISKERQKYEDIIKKEETQYQAQRKAAGETGVDWGRIGGNIANPLNYVGGAPTTLPRLLGMGAVQGAATPIYNTDQYGGQLVQNIGEGALTAGLFGVGAKALGGAKNVVSDLTAPMTESGRQRLAQEFVRNTVPAEAVPQVQAAIRNPNAYVEGSIPSVGESVAHIPEAANLASLQAKMANSPEVAPIFAARDTANEAARANAVAKLGGEFVSDAEKARTELTAPMREAALTAAKPVQAESLANALETVANSKAYKGSGIAEDSLKYFANAFRDAATEGVVTPEAMYNIRKRVGQDIQGLAAQKGINSLDATAIKADTSIKNIIDNAIEATGGKGWKDYLTAFEQESTKINRMKVGEYLQETLKGKFNAENAGAFATAIQNAPQTLKTSTGVSRYKEMADLLSKDDVKLLTGVKDDLLREQTYKTLASKSTQGTKFADGETIPHFLNRTATITNYALKKFNSDADKKINQYLAGLDNEKWAALFDAIPPNKADAWVKATFSRINPDLREKLVNGFTSISNRVEQQLPGLSEVNLPTARGMGLVGAEAVRRESALPGEQLQQQPVQQVQPQSQSAIVNQIHATAQQKGAAQLAPILTAIAKTESGFNPNAKNKNSSATGLFQLTKAAQKDVGVTNPRDVNQNINGGIDYFLKMMKRYNGDVRKALAAYNQGMGVVDRGINKEGRDYVKKVLANL
jgi:hypothetical protein